MSYAARQLSEQDSIMDELAYRVLADREHCAEMAEPATGNFVVSIVILIGILISYLPQHYKIIRNRSSAGLSPYFVLLGATSGTCAIANILTLPTSREDIACCKVNSAFSCAAGLLGIAQIGLQWACFFLITFLFILFIPRINVYSNDDDVAIAIPPDYAWRQALVVFTTSIVFFVAIFIISVVMLGAYPHHLQRWAEILGTFGGFLACVQYIPQIIMTYRRGSVGSLSIGMMCIQTPGSFVFVASLAARLGRDGWSSWFVYLVTGVLQGILLGMAIYFTMQEGELENERGARNDADSDYTDDMVPSRTCDLETDPLLPVPGPDRNSRSTTSFSTGPRNESLNENSRRFSNIGTVIASALGFGPGRQTADGAEAEDLDSPSRSHTRSDSIETIIGPTRTSPSTAIEYLRQQREDLRRSHTGSLRSVGDPIDPIDRQESFSENGTYRRGGSVTSKTVPARAQSAQAVQANTSTHRTRLTKSDGSGTL